MANFFAELKRRHIYRVGAAYVVVAWALTQAVDVLSQIFDLPSWIAQPVIVLLAVGFPVALIVAWTIESKPHQAVAAAVRSKPTIVDWTLCGALAVVMLFMAYQQIAPSSDATTRQVGVDAARSAASSPAGAISLAVLPFVNLSSDAEQEFFSDGMTEEITSALAKIADLRVVGRTSAFQFKDEQKDLRAIGQALGATHLIEGSVRKEGNRLRITAQLIEAENGVHVWTENYDRELTGVFAIQEDIATAIAGALRMPLGLAPGERLVSNRGIDAESYQQYLRAKTLVRDRRIPQVNQAIAILEQVVAHEPNHAPAWALLALAYAVVPQTPALLSDDLDNMRSFATASLVKAEPAAQRAIELDPNLPDGYAALGRLNLARGKLLAADGAYSKALALDQNYPDALQLYGNLLAEVGRLKESLSMMRRMQALEPFVPTFGSNAAVVMWLNGQDDAAISTIEALPVNTTRQVQGSQIYASLGRYREAADLVQAIPAGAFLPGIVENAVRLLRTAPSAVASPRTLPRLGVLSFIYLHVGAPDRILDAYEDWVAAGYSVGLMTGILWHPTYASVRKTERFKAFVRKAGLVEYWRARGWPELCRPAGADDFECS